MTFFFLVQITVCWLACCILASKESQIIKKLEGTASFRRKDQDAITHQLLGRKQNKNPVLYSLGRWGTLRKSLTHLRKNYQDVAQSCPTLCDLMDCSLPVSSIHGIFQAWILEWVAISFSRGSSRLRDQTWVSRITGRRFTLLSHQRSPKEYIEILKIISSMFHFKNHLLNINKLLH